MEVEYSQRPSSVLHDPPDWQQQVRALPRPPIDREYSAPPPPSQFVIAQRRRSSIPHPGPIGPPPSHPIPSVPSRSQTPYGDHEGHMNEVGYVQMASYPPSGAYNYSRPMASPNLAAVAAFSQARYASESTDPPASPLLSPPMDALSRQMTEQSNPQLSHAEGGNALLAPPDPSAPRPSSRRALTRALELAREAVKLDATNDDPEGAVQAYGQSVALLKEVMERVMRGDDSTDGSHRKRNGRRRSVVAQEEEVRRLKSIHDTYAERMNILSLIYDIPVMPLSPSSTYLTSSSSALATRDRSDTDLLPPPMPPALYSGVYEFRQESSRWGVEEAEAIGAGTFMTSLADTSATSTTVVEQHPYATGGVTPSYDLNQQFTSRQPAAHLPSQQTYPPVTRRRALSSLPPMAPPPTSAPPPPPSITESSSSPPRQSMPGTDGAAVGPGHVSGHKRTGSGNKLVPLHEDDDILDLRLRPIPQDTAYHDSAFAGRSMTQGAPISYQPLDGLPTTRSRTPSPVTPRIAGLPVVPQDIQPDQVGSLTWNNNALLPRGRSSVSLQNGFLINSSVGQGAISYRRRNKTSASPSGGSSPSESTVSAGSAHIIGSKVVASTSPANGSHFAPSAMGRSRSSSQPGSRPPLLVNPPAPTTASLMSGSRKLPQPSRLNPNAPPVAGTNSGLLSPPAAASSLTLVSPPTPTLPTVPLSHQPHPPPVDPLRKPYHMMSMLRNTIINKSGGYITRRLHVPSEVWLQAGAKLTNVPEKIRVVVVLCSALDDLQMSSNEFCGAGSVNSGFTSGIGSIGRREAETWSTKLEEFSLICDGLVSDFGKKLGVGEGFVIKKNGLVTNWGSKFARQFDKFTANGKNLDSPASYAQDLSRLFTLAQLLDEHTQAIHPQTLSPVYAALPSDIRMSLEPKLKRASEFFASVVLTFVIRDLSQLLEKFAKRWEKWIAE